MPNILTKYLLMKHCPWLRNSNQCVINGNGVIDNEQQEELVQTVGQQKNLVHLFVCEQKSIFAQW